MCDLKDEYIGPYFYALITCLINMRNYLFPYYDSFIPFKHNCSFILLREKLLPCVWLLRKCMK